MKKYYRTVYTYEVLSEEPVNPNYSFATIVDEANNGDYSGRLIEEKETVLTGKQMAKALKNQGNDPEFFNLTENGEEISI